MFKKANKVVNGFLGLFNDQSNYLDVVILDETVRDFLDTDKESSFRVDKISLRGDVKKVNKDLNKVLRSHPNYSAVVLDGKK
jgi:hypothetical protein